MKKFKNKKDILSNFRKNCWLCEIIDSLHPFAFSLLYLVECFIIQVANMGSRQNKWRQVLEYIHKVSSSMLCRSAYGNFLKMWRPWSFNISLQVVSVFNAWGLLKWWKSLTVHIRLYQFTNLFAFNSFVFLVQFLRLRKVSEWRKSSGCSKWKTS